jgi:phosphate transport system substrate-binding protein
VNRTSIRRAAAPTLAAVTLGAALAGCGAPNEQVQNTSSEAHVTGVSGTLNGAGSSAQEAAQGAWTAGFQRANPDVTVNYDPIGSGGGVEQFLEGGVSFAGTDAYLTDVQVAASKKVCNGETALEVPDYISPIAVAYNLPGVDGLRLSPDTLAQIMSGKITRWDDPAIKKENPGTTLPAQRITPVHRSDESGTTFNFTDYLSQASGKWGAEPSETWPFRSGEGAQGTAGVVAAVKHGTGTIGYADASQLGSLSAARIKVGDAYVAPSAESAAKVLEVSQRAEGRSGNDLAFDLARDTSESGTYPIVLVSYLVACPTYADQRTADLVRGYLGYVVSLEGQRAAARTAGSAPLPESLSEQAARYVGQISAKG